MHKSLLVILISILLVSQTFSEEGFFIQNRDGVLIKVDLETGLKLNNPEKKGPGIGEEPKEIDAAVFEKEYLDTITDETDKNFILEAYEKNTEKNQYILRTDYVPEKIKISVIKTGILGNLNVPEKRFLSDFYKIDNKSGFYNIKKNLSDDQKKSIASGLMPLLARMIFLQYNKKNEIPSALQDSGAPSPHKFPRVFNPYTKGAIDIQFCWGYKFQDTVNPDLNVTLEFSLNLTNFVMPSLGILLKHNFIISDNPTFSPYIGGMIYGGFIDGFPIGLSFLGGSDIFPTYLKDGKTNFYLLAEGRIGVVIYSKLYFDTGSNADGIWKKIGVLAEGGFYFGTGYRWDKK